VAELRRRLFAAPATNPPKIQQTGAAAFGISVLNYPWRQRFEGSVDKAGTQNISGGFVSQISLAQRVTNAATFTAFETLVVGNAGK
jgi:hypothetical protein